MDEENVLDFLTSLEAMDLPDRIEEVNAMILEKIVEETDFVAVLFCEFSFPRNSNMIFCQKNHLSLSLFLSPLKANLHIFPFHQEECRGIIKSSQR